LWIICDGFLTAVAEPKYPLRGLKSVYLQKKTQRKPAATFHNHLEHFRKSLMTDQNLPTPTYVSLRQKHLNLASLNRPRPKTHLMTTIQEIHAGYPLVLYVIYSMGWVSGL